MSAPRIGSLCTGYGGLDMAAVAVLGGTVAWVADPDPGAAALLAHHHPGLPNLGDITAVDFTTVPAVDVVTAGFPCQDLSYAGRGAGIQKGNRSGLWHTIADAVGVLRPRYLLLENVAAIVARRPGLDVVLSDLAALGFDADWTHLRASDVGAPHQRERWFAIAHTPHIRHQRSRDTRQRWARPANGGVPASDPAGKRHRNARTPSLTGVAAPALTGVAADPQGDGRYKGRPEPAGIIGGPDVALGGGAVAADPGGPRRQGPRPTGQDRRPVPAAHPRHDWGRYGPAIARWEHITGRPAPAPTGPAPRGGQRLSPTFVEWLMGLPAGWVTDVPALTRNQQLRLLGNGVVPQQGAAALAALAAAFPERGAA